MKISLEWLRQYVDYMGTPEALAELFTNVGFPVEEMEQVGDDWMLDVEVTSNRPDCLGHIGLAREVAAVTGVELKLPELNFAEEGKPVESWTRVADEAPELCGRYTARLIDHIVVGPSPDWMRRRLETIGVRVINNVVDITNYILMEIGQPLHTFDYARLKEGKIIVRAARQGEKMEMIDHSTVELKDYMLVIADAEKPVALAGVMGGLDSEVSEQTRCVLLESAHFDPLCIRRTSRDLTLGSESSYRFERTVDMEMLEWASRRAAALLVECAGGKVAPGVVDVWPGRTACATVQMRLSRLKNLVGIHFDAEYVLGLLGRLGFEPNHDGGDIIACTVPSWRRADVSREADLIEEVIRIYGYNHVPTEPKIHITVKTPDAFQRTHNKVSQTLGSCGYYETISVSFLEDDHIKPFVPDGFEPVRVKDYSRKSNNALRPSLLPSLLLNRKRNQDAGSGSCHFYELAAVHRQADRDQTIPNEDIMLSLISDGTFRRLRGVLDALLGNLDHQVKLICEPAELLWAEPGTGCRLVIKDYSIGYAGQAARKIQNQFGLDNETCMADIYFDKLIELEGRVPKMEPIMRFPAITRDLSLVIDEELPWAQVEQTIRDQKIEDLREVHFVDIYRGKGIEMGKKSLTLSLIFRRENETLRHEQADEYQETVLNALRDKYNATLRS